MNKTLNVVIFVVVIVIFCVAAYLYINHTNKQYKEHFSQINFDQVTLHEDEYDLNIASIEESIPDFNCSANTDQNNCNSELCKYDTVNNKCLNSDEFVFKIIKINLDNYTSDNVIKLPEYRDHVYRENPNSPKLIIAELINANNSITPINDIMIVYENEDTIDEIITVIIPQNCLNSGCSEINGQSVHLVVKALFRKEVNDNKPPTSPAVYNCNVEQANYDTLKECLVNDCNVEYHTNNNNRYFKCKDNTITQSEEDVLVIKIELVENDSKKITIGNYDSTTKNNIARLFNDYINNQQMTLDNLIYESTQLPLKIVPINTTNNIDYSKISLTSNNNELTITNNGTEISLYLLLIPKENSIMATPSAETSTVCSQYGVSQDCLNQICLEQTNGYYDNLGNYIGTQCDLSQACTPDNIQIYCQNEISNPSPSVSTPYPSPQVNVPYPSPQVNVPYPSPQVNVPYPSPSVSTPYPSPSVSTPYPSPSVSTP
jgi:hypothetical protein